MFDRANLNLAIVCLPPFAHSNKVEYAAKHGIHVLPVLPIQILWINMVTSVVLGLMLALVADSVRANGAVRVVTACLANQTWADLVPDVSALATDAFVIFPWGRRALMAGEWKPHPEIVAALHAQGIFTH